MKISEMQAPALPLIGLELVPGLQGDDNTGIPLFAYGQLPNGEVVLIRNVFNADLSATTDADPGAGKLRWNNAAPGSATVLYIDDADSAATAIATLLQSAGVGGFLYVQANGTAARRAIFQKWQITSITDAVGYTKVGVSLQDSNGAFVADETIEVSAQKATPSPGVDRNIVTNVSSSAGVVTIDCSLGDYFTLTLTENVTGWVFTNVPAGASILIEITQGATVRTVAWPAAFKWAGSAGAVSTVASAKDMLAITTFNAGGAWKATLAKAFA